VRLGLVAAKPTDAVTYGLLPAAARLGLEVFLLTDQPDGHAGALARARADLGRAAQGVQPRIVGCDVHDARALVGRMAGAYAWNISHHGFLMHPPPAFHYLA
jgi:hypothetical protein